MNYKRKVVNIFFILIIIVIILFKYDSINSVNDISRLNKVEIYDVNNNKIYEVNNYHESSYVSIDKINPLALKAIVNIEDKNFYRHSGFDIYRIIKAGFKNIFTKQKIGASTITQQYVKNLYLSNKQTYVRKAKELNYAIRLERIYTKDEILEGYLNTIYFGHNLYGISDACKYYFNKSPNGININEIALLIAIIKSPTKYSPVNHYSNAMNRKNTILKILHKNKIINQTQFNTFYTHNIPIYKSNINSYNNALLFYKDQVLKEYSKLKIHPKFNSVYKIYTNYNDEVNEHLANYISNMDLNCDLGVSIVDSHGYYVSNIGGTNYYKSSYNVCSDGLRDIGSTIKPLLYYEALNEGFTPLTTFTSEKCSFYVNNEIYNFSNYHDVYENKKITLGYALATSDNIFAVKTHLYLGMNNLVNNLKKYGIKSKEIPSLALGSVSMSLNKLTNIYHSFSTLGEYVENKYIREIKLNNNTVYSSNNKKKTILDPSATFVLNNVMTNTFDTNLSSKISVTGTAIAPYIDYTLAAKSGLTDYDSYMIGFNPLYTVGVWVGYLDNAELSIKSQQGIPKYVFKEAFNNLMKNKEDIWYKCPKNVSTLFTDPTLFNTGYKKLVYFKD